MHRWLAAHPPRTNFPAGWCREYERRIKGEPPPLSEAELLRVRGACKLPARWFAFFCPLVRPLHAWLVAAHGPKAWCSPSALCF